jgi:hypothetical protein
MNDMSDVPAGVQRQLGLETWTLPLTPEETRAGVAAILVILCKRATFVVFECDTGITVAGCHCGHAMDPRWDRQQAIDDARAFALRRLHKLNEAAANKRQGRSGGAR